MVFHILNRWNLLAVSMDLVILCLDAHSDDTIMVMIILMAMTKM